VNPQICSVIEAGSQYETKTAAIFDVDGTLIEGTSLERIFFKYLLSRGHIRLVDLLNLATTFVHYAATDWRRATRTNKSYLRSRSADFIKGLARDCFEQQIIARLSRKGLEQIIRHKQRGHRVVLLSGSLNVLLEPLRDYLQADEVIGSTLEESNGEFTGFLVGPHPFAVVKKICLINWAEANGICLAQSYAYADRWTDHQMLACVGHPVAVNPDRRLLRIARQLGWIVERFSNKQSQ